jgi:uncharacterized protein
MEWKIKQKLKLIPKLNNPILIEGLPGIGNVGKVAVDFLIDELEANLLYEFHSYSFPHSIFVNEKNLVEMPKISMHLVKRKGKKRDILFLSGDIQPIDEKSCYLFVEEILNICKNLGCNEVIALGGIGLSDIPEEPKIFITGNTKKQINEFKKGLKIYDKLYGLVGPIVGVSGLICGMAPEKKIDSIILLAETHGHPMYLGIKGAQELLKVLDNKFNLKINILELENEVKGIEEELLKRKEEINELQKNKSKKQNELCDRVNYIG